MNSFRKWFYRPRRDDTSLMAQFYYADEKLNLVAGELDSFDGRKDPERCTALVNQLRQAQDKVLNICIEMMDNLLSEERAPRDFRVKFPDDVMQETLSGQLWFGAECLAAGSSILNREAESTRMRPLAKAVTKTIESVRNLLREQCLKPIPEYTEKIRESLKIFDKLFADFELSYVSAMVPVKTVEEYEMQQNVIVLFSDTLQRSTKLGLVTQEQIDDYDPALMFTIPRLAIVAGLVIFPDGPLNLERDSKNMSELFRPFKTLLHKIRELLWTMSPSELATLEKCLCSMEEPDINIQSLQTETAIPQDLDLGPVSCTSDFVHRFYANYPSCRQLTPEMFSLCSANKKPDKNDRKRERNSSKSSRTRARQERQSERFLSRLTGIEERPRARRRSRRGNSQSQSQAQHHHPPAHYFQYPEHFHQEVFPPPPPPPTPTTAQHTHSSQSVPEQGVSSHCSSSSYRQSHLRSSTSSPIPIFVSISDIRQGQVSSRHHRSRQPYQSSRHRADRISTITCACGSTNSHVPVSANRICVNPTTDQNSHFCEQQYVPSEGYCPYPNSSTACPVYKAPSHVEASDYYGPRSFSPQDANSTYNEGSNSSVVKNVSDNPELSRHGVIQNCVTNTINVDPCVLSPSNGFYDQGNTETSLPQPASHSQVDPISSEISRLNIIDESLNHERGNCDVCNNLQSCYCDSNIFDTKVHQGQDYSPEQGKINASYVDEKSCSCNSNVDDAQDKSISVHSEINSTSVVVAPTPEPRRSRTSLKPYGPKASRHEFSKSSDERNGKITKEERLESSLQNSCDYEKALDEVEREGDSSGSTSPHHSGTEDDEEVALALQAAEVAVSWKARERFSDPGDLIQRLFVCISGVADQLQTNYASDLRKILRCVFMMNQTPEEEEVEIVEGKEHFPSAREPGNEDVTSTNGSEQLSVESAEDALEIIDIPESGERLNSPDEASDIEEETSPNLSSSLSDDSVSRSPHTSSVTVPPSVFNDHSLMQYSTMSPPPFLSERAYDSILEAQDITSDNDSPNNEIYSSQMSNNGPSEHDSSQTDNYVYNLNLETIHENTLSSTSGQEALMPIATLIPVNSSTGSPTAFVDSFPTNQQFPSTPVQDPSEGLSRRYPIVQEPPSWIPDNVAPRCMACGALFTVVRRRHHCRNCGKVFCGHCSRHSVPLPHFGIWKNVRVCNACFLYYVTSSADGSSALS